MRAQSFKRSVALNNHDTLWVIIPCRNEQKNIESCLESFRHQTDKRFRIVFVDNASTDQTVITARRWVYAHHDLSVDIVSEETPGIGSACVTGCAHAIQLEAKILARTDADSVVGSDWVRQARLSLIEGYDFMAGKMKAQPEEITPILIIKSWLVYWSIHASLTLVRILRRQPSSKILMAGANMAITTELYQYVGGFSATARNEDAELTSKVLEVTRNGRKNRQMIVYTSLRRIKQSGYFGTLRWYLKKSGS